MRNSSVYDVETYIADIYDQIITEQDDVLFIKQHLGDKNKLSILEPFCGTGRISIPLAVDGHSIVGIDNAKGMLDWFQRKLDNSKSAGEVKLINQDVLAKEWPRGFDLVILAANCFYELATSEVQEECIKRAFKSLRAGGYLYVDSDHMEGDLAKSWQDLGQIKKSLCGIAQDGAVVETTRKTIWFDVKKRLARFERGTTVTKKNGEVIKVTSIQQKHPVSTGEVQDWIQKHGFEIIKIYGNSDGAAYTEQSTRAIFWARKP